MPLVEPGLRASGGTLGTLDSVFRSVRALQDAGDTWREAEPRGSALPGGAWERVVYDRMPLASPVCQQTGAPGAKLQAADASTSKRWRK